MERSEKLRQAIPVRTKKEPDHWSKVRATTELLRDVRKACWGVGKGYTKTKLEKKIQEKFPALNNRVTRPTTSTRTSQNNLHPTFNDQQTRQIDQRSR
ncbi:hypothetical protein QJS10_CPA03g00985 [Acorus calamus]|uniref:Uncharacterized protein n=1 Tax=Acorus calamus TaxID=4465 RepID=A0AAV9FAR9_ACOCL|nr:hypothetical protein QJS10_CPA03g00985 [Acorus calamus]